VSVPATEADSTAPEAVAGFGFAGWVIGATALGLLVRLAYVFGPARNRNLGGDPAYYRGLAKVLADGHGFIEPLVFTVTGRHVASATHPPLFPTVLAVFTKLGVTGTLGQRVVTCLIGVTIVPLAALCAQRLMGTTAAVIVALLAALNPAFWMNDVNVLSEALLAPLIAAIVLVAIASRPRSAMWRAALLGALIGLAALTRAEVGLLLPLLAFPVVWNRSRLRSEALWSIAVATIAMAAVLAPWTIYNQTRFDQPVLLSNNFGGTLSSANCDAAWHGSKLGWWQFGCEGNVKEPGDESVRDHFLRRRATDYIGNNLSRLPVVIAAREGREWDVWRPTQTVALDGVEGRGLWPTRVGFVFYVLMVALSIPGVIWLRRTRAPIAWFVAPLALSVISAAAFYGSPRFRVPADVVLTIAAGIGAAFLLSRPRAAASEPIGAASG
jgi:4-amino-4-deoxy-L-arabinose transferase-like glycosyltransferase